jgi:hypothetical protein
VEGSGEAAEGFVWTIAVLPTEELPPEGREFAAEFEKRFGTGPCRYGYLGDFTIDRNGDTP